MYSSISRDEMIQRIENIKNNKSTNFCTLSGPNYRLWDPNNECKEDEKFLLAAGVPCCELSRTVHPSRPSVTMAPPSVPVAHQIRASIPVVTQRRSIPVSTVGHPAYAPIWPDQPPTPIAPRALSTSEGKNIASMQPSLQERKKTALESKYNLQRKTHVDDCTNRPGYDLWSPLSECHSLNRKQFTTPTGLSCCTPASESPEEQNLINVLEPFAANLIITVSNLLDSYLNAVEISDLDTNFNAEDVEKYYDSNLERNITFATELTNLLLSIAPSSSISSTIHWRDLIMSSIPTVTLAIQNVQNTKLLDNIGNFLTRKAQIASKVIKYIDNKEKEGNMLPDLVQIRKNVNLIAEFFKPLINSVYEIRNKKTQSSTWASRQAPFLRFGNIPTRPLIPTPSKISRIAEKIDDNDVEEIVRLPIPAKKIIPPIKTSSAPGAPSVQLPMPTKSRTKRPRSIEKPLPASSRTSATTGASRKRTKRQPRSVTSETPQDIADIINMIMSSKPVEARIYKRPLVEPQLLTSGTIETTEEVASSLRDYPCFHSSMGDNLKVDQIRPILYLLENENSTGLLADHGTGTGKTFLAVAAIKCFLDNINSKLNILAVMPASLVNNFKKAMKRWNLSGSNIKVMSFEGFDRIYKEGKIDCANSFLIVDEAHRLVNPASFQLFWTEEEKKAAPHLVPKTPKGIQVANIIKCEQSARNNGGFRKVLLMSGTPLGNSPIDIVNLMSIIDGTLPLNNKERKQFEGIVEDAFPEYPIKPDVASIQLLRNMIQCKVSYYMPPPETEDFPKREDFVIDIVMDPDYYREYMALEKNETKKLGINIPFKVDDESDEKKSKWDSFYVNIRQAGTNLRGVDNPKVRFLVNHFLEEPRRRTIIYTPWDEKGIVSLEAAFRMAGIPTFIISGRETQAERSAMVEKWNLNSQDRNVPVFLITDAGGTGVDYKNVEDIYVTEPFWNFLKLEQVGGRGPRYTLDKTEAARTVNIYFMRLVKPEDIPLEENKEGKTEIVAIDPTSKQAKIEPKPSVDVFMWNRSMGKQRVINEYTNQVIVPASIQKQWNKCFTRKYKSETLQNVFSSRTK